MNLVILIIAGVFNCFGTIKTDSYSNLKQITKEFWDWRLEQEPELATVVGVHKYDDKLESFNYSVYETRKVACDDFLRRLQHVNRDTLEKLDQLELDVVKHGIQTYVNGYKWKDYGNLNPISRMPDGFALFTGIRLSYVVFDKYIVFRNYVSRLQKLPSQIDDQIDLMRRAIQLNTTLHAISVTPVLGKFASLSTPSVEDHPYYNPLQGKLDNVTSVPAENKTALREDASTAIEAIKLKLVELSNFLRNDYLPKTRTKVGVGSLPNGMEYYADILKWHLTVDQTPSQIHQQGIQEVNRLKNEMENIKMKLNFKGSLQDFFSSLRNTTAFPNFYSTSEAEYLQRFRNIIFNKATPQIKQLFHDVPDYPLVVKPSESSGTGGSYTSATPNGKPGIFWASIRDYEHRAIIDMTPLALHEANPGHHLQASYQLANHNLPAYRQFAMFYRSYSAPFFFPPYVAYSEGWAVYAETLGLEMDGVYVTDYDRFGLLSSLMLRACRVVVDTGIHAKGWTREAAITYMLDHVFSVRPVIEAEVDRYISWPGQAVTYTIGKLKFQELRKKSKEKLKERFNVKEFHRIVLQNGRLPLNNLEQIVNEWIQLKNKPVSGADMNALSNLLLLTVCTLFPFIFG